MPGSTRAASERRAKPSISGKVAAAGFFAATVLPRLAAEREIAEATSLDPMEVAEEAF